MKFSFFRIKVLYEIVFTRLPRFKIFYGGRTLEKEVNSWKIAKKMVICTIVCCHGNSLQHTHINAK